MKKIFTQMKIKWNSMRTKILLIMIITNFIIIGLLSVGAFTYYEKSFVNEIGTNRSDVLSQIADRAKVFKTNSYTVSNLYYNDQQFRQYTQNLTDGNKEEFFTYMNEITNQYKTSFSQVNLEYYVVYLSSQGIGYCSDQTPEDYDYMNPKIKIWYRDLYKANGDIVDVPCYKDRQLGINSFSTIRTVSGSDGEIIGYLMINIDERQIYDTYKDVINGNSNIYIVSDKGTIISSNQSKLIGFEYFNMDNLKKMFGDSVYIISENTKRTALFTKFYDPVSGFTVFEEIELNQLLHPLVQVKKMIWFFSGCALVLGLLVAAIASDCLASPIIKLKNHVQNVESGNLMESFDVSGYTEIDALNEGMKKMLSQIRDLLEREKIKEAQKRKIEMNLLQAQINPHFMYNTLFSIKCIVDMGDNKRAALMITSFIKLLRSTLSNPEEMGTVESELEVLKKYIELQKFRYAEGFDAIIECDQSIADKKIPKLLVQPLVENSIFHGVEAIGGCGMITVVARPLGEDISIEVEDNGVGMTESMVHTIMNEEVESEKLHIGIKNVNDRIKLRFGSKYGLSIESTVNVGTKIKILIPAID